MHVVGVGGGAAGAAGADLVAEGVVGVGCRADRPRAAQRRGAATGQLVRRVVLVGADICMNQPNILYYVTVFPSQNSMPRLLPLVTTIPRTTFGSLSCS